MHWPRNPQSLPLPWTKPYFRTMVLFATINWAIKHRWSFIKSLTCCGDAWFLRDWERIQIFYLSFVRPNLRKQVTTGAKSWKFLLLFQVIEAKSNECQCLTLTVREDCNVFCLSSIAVKMKQKIGFQNGSPATRVETWKLKWFSAESVRQFVTLLMAIHEGSTGYSMSVTYIT